MDFIVFSNQKLIMRNLFLLCCLGIGISIQAQQNKALNDALVAKTLSFYKFYLQNEKSFNNVGLYGSVKKNEYGPPYKINWPVVNKYFTFLRTKAKQHVGELFIQNEKNFFNTCDSNFKAYPNEEMPSGFDFDRIVGGNEDPKEVVKFNFAKGGKWDVAIDKDTATVSYTRSYKLDKNSPAENYISTTKLVKEKGIWKIAVPMGRLYTIDD